MLEQGHGVLIGIGGPDSISLLHILKSLEERLLGADGSAYKSSPGEGIPMTTRDM